jgi:hypothetical protein
MKWLTVQVDDEIYEKFKAVWKKFYPTMKKRMFLKKVLTDYCNRFNGKI